MKKLLEIIKKQNSSWKAGAIQQSKLSFFLPKTTMPKSAFTLAEVLITLGIIGVVAAMTIPSLMTKTRNREYKSRFLKTYSELNQAVSLMAQNGYDSEDEKYMVFTTRDYILDMKQFLSVAQYKNPGGIALHVLNYNGSNFVSAGCPQPFNSNHIIKLNNGSYIDSIRNCSKTWISVDLNGEKKPNRFGYDVFAFYVYKNKLMMEKQSAKTSDGLGSVSCSKVNPTILGEDGRSCSYWALIDKNPDDNSKDYWDTLD